MSQVRTAAETASELRIGLGRLVRRLRAENTLSISQGTVLARLDRDGPQTASALALAENVRPQSMAQTVADLQAAGLVNRRPHPFDRRQILIELTEAGGQELCDERRRREGWLALAIATELTPEEQRTLAEAAPLLARIGSV